MFGTKKIRYIRYDNISWLLILSVFVALFLSYQPTLHAANYSFQWDANDSSDNVVAYRIYWSTTSESYNSSDMEELLETSLSDPNNPQWTITIPDPPAGEFYYFVCTAVDDENLESVYSFEIEAAAPQITSPPTIIDVTNTSAVISWSTDEPADSDVQYGDNSASWDSYDLSQSDSDMVISHSVTITGLFGDTDYFFRVGSTNEAGYGPMISNEDSFTTDIDPDIVDPVITTPPTVTNVTNTAATIFWITDEPSNSQVQYGDNSSSWGTYDQTQPIAAMTTNHSVTITGLLATTNSALFVVFGIPAQVSELSPYRTWLFDGSSVSHAIVAVLSVVPVTVGDDVISGASKSGADSVAKVLSPDQRGPLSASSVEPTRK